MPQVAELSDLNLISHHQVLTTTMTMVYNCMFKFIPTLSILVYPIIIY